MEMWGCSPCVSGIPDESYRVPRLHAVPVFHDLAVEMGEVDVRVSDRVTKPDDFSTQIGHVDPIDDAV